ncbi:DegT/DnrJ/EryC1/StrS family aminotransferase [Lachnobacterium bovis]|uniref:DegT/DnrJ/EryC1/StrS aminotransferase family protein n=1 Tax=Lachnobacterium bovis TaxID=140626 RepID=A0A1H9PFY3_9FIRM|nr:DegT/DnrJ/EryC1/StrS family aminotransferase [Lachnobacterium bovis]SER47010.1 DegT/DnrJ/EryC1/StrS aminotransferase family protein [Lachnobacterium bovis]
MKKTDITTKDIIFFQDLIQESIIDKYVDKGAVPVLIDSERDTLNMDPVALELAFRLYETAKTVIVANLYGTQGHINELKEICKKHNAILVEVAKENVENSKETLIKFNDIETYMKKKKEIYEKYKHAFDDLPVEVNPNLDESKSKFWNSFIRIDTETVYGLSLEFKQTTPEMIRKKLEDENFLTKPIIVPLHLTKKYRDCEFVALYKYAEHFYEVDRSVSTDAYTCCLCLPSDVELDEDKQEKIIDIIRKMFVKQTIKF